MRPLKTNDFRMKRLTKLAIAITLLLSTGVHAQNQLSIIPQPLELEQKQGNYLLTEKTVIRIDGRNPELSALGELLAQGLFERTGIRLTVSSSQKANEAAAITLQLVSDTLGDEGYRLSVGKGGITARAEKANGLFYAIQSIYQLLPVEMSAGSDIAIPFVEIMDRPRFGWRGLMLDVGRYFYSVDYIKKYIDYLAMHKMNVFH